MHFIWVTHHFTIASNAHSNEMFALVLMNVNWRKIRVSVGTFHAITVFNHLLTPCLVKISGWKETFSILDTAKRPTAEKLFFQASIHGSSFGLSNNLSLLFLDE